MPKLKISPSLLLIAFLSYTWILRYNIQKAFLPKFKTITICVPTDRNKSYPFTSFSLLNQIKNKKKIPVEINNDRLTNQKKINFIQYEARKLKYTKDTATVIDITFTNKVNYGEILQLLNICYEDEHSIFALVKNRLIIFGEYPSRPKDTTRE